MKQDTVSIIIPVYNPGKRLEACVSSLLNQTYKDLEIILVNDASKDGSDVICRRYTEEGTIFKYICHEENKGQTITRNDGINAVEGEWMLFLDADDTLEPDAIEKLVGVSKRDNADIVFSDYKTIRESGEERSFSSELKEGKYTTKEFVQHFYSSFSMTFLSCIGTKLYRTDFVKDRKPSTPNAITTNYDIAFILDALSANPTISYIRKVTYIYYQVEGSITHSYRKNMFKGFTAARIKLLPLLQEYSCYEEKKLDYHLTRYAIISWSLKQEIQYSKGYGHFKEVFNSICEDTSINETIKVITTSDKNLCHRWLIRLFKSKKNCIIAYMVYSMFGRKH